MDAPESSRKYPFIPKSDTSTPGYYDSSRCNGNKRVKPSGPIPIGGSSIGQCRCKCAHARLQSRLTLVTFVISVVAALIGTYAVCINRTEGPQSCGLSDEDRLLLQELRSLKSVIVQKNVPEDGPIEAVESRSGQNDQLPIWKHRVKRQANKKKRKKGKRSRKGKVRAAHYVPKFWEDRKEEEYGEEMCISVKNWGGQACRNRTLKMSKGPIKFFHEAEWLHKSSNILKPAKQHKDGSFEMLENGLYLLYSSVLFYDSKKKQSQAIVKNGNRLFKCMEGVDYISDDGDKPYNSKYKSCSVTGVTYLKKGDRLSVGNLYNNTLIDMSEDSTFFGIVQLVPGVKTKKSRKTSR